jgi:hypothetical protein
MNQKIEGKVSLISVLVVVFSLFDHGTTYSCPIIPGKWYLQ